MSDDAFLAAFERCHIARKDWTHEAHVRVAWLFVQKHGLPVTVDVEQLYWTKPYPNWNTFQR